MGPDQGRCVSPVAFHTLQQDRMLPLLNPRLLCYEESLFQVVEVLYTWVVEI